MVEELIEKLVHAFFILTQKVSSRLRGYVLLVFVLFVGLWTNSTLFDHGLPNSFLSILQK